MSLKKICWMDCETTGLDSKVHGIWQLALLIEIDGEVVAEKEFACNPSSSVIWDEAAFLMADVPLEEMQSFPSESEMKNQVREFLCEHVNPFNKGDKFTAAGYNVKFDMDFFEQFWLCQNDTYLYSFFTHRFLDVMEMYTICEWLREAKSLPRNRLEDVARELGVPFEGEAHTAMVDIQVTRKIAVLLKDLLKVLKPKRRLVDG